MYQAHRALHECPGFAAFAQFHAGPEIGPIFVGLRADALEIYTTSEWQYLFDLEGRPVRFSTRNEYFFRGVSHQGTVARKRPAGAGGGLERFRLEPAVLERLCRNAWQVGAAAHAALTGGALLERAHPDPERARTVLDPLLRRVAAWTPERLAGEAQRFAEVYQPVPILPPDHYASLVLQATEGCTFNTCTFCALYRGSRYRVRSVDEFDRHVRAALAFHGEGLRRLQRIFLGQANALAAPQARLVELLQGLHRHVELPGPSAPTARPSWAAGHCRRFLGIGSFLDGFTGLTKTPADYAQLRSLGLDRIYVGVESGSASLLRWLEKPATPDQMLTTLRNLKAAGLATDVILLVGVGGTSWATAHVRDSLAFLQASPLRPGDRVYLSTLVELPDAPYGARMDAERRARLDAEGLQAQRAALIAGIRKLGLQAVPYRIEPFVY